MADNYKELSRSGWTVVSDKGRVFGSESDDSGEQSDFVALEKDVAHFYHSSTSIKVERDEPDTDKNADNPVSPLDTESLEEFDEAEPLEKVAGNSEEVDITENYSPAVVRCSDGLQDQVVIVPTIEREISISDVIEENVRARLNISRSYSSSASSTFTSSFLLKEIPNGKLGMGSDSSDTNEDGNGVECGGISDRLQDVCLSKQVFSENNEKERVSDSDSDFEHLSQDEIPNNEGGQESDSIEPIGLLSELNSRLLKSEENLPLFPTSSDDSDTSRLFNPGRGHRGIRKRVLAGRSRHSSASKTAAAGIDKSKERDNAWTIWMDHGRLLYYILLLIIALVIGYYIGSSKIFSYKQHLEQGQTQRLHTLQDELLTCLKSEEIHNDKGVLNEHKIQDPGVTVMPTKFDKKQLLTEDVQLLYNNDIAMKKMNAVGEDDWVFVEDAIGNSHGSTDSENIAIKTEDSFEKSNKSTENEKMTIGEDWKDMEDTIESSKQMEENEKMTIGGGDWMDIEDAIESSKQMEEDEKMTIGGGDSMDMEDTIESSKQMKENEKMTIGGGDWMDMEDAIESSKQMEKNEKITIGGGDWMDIEDAIESSKQMEEDEKMTIGGGDWMDIEDAIESSKQMEEDEKMTIGGGDGMDMEDVIESSKQMEENEKMTIGGGDWMDMEDAIESSKQMEENEKMTIGGGDWMDMEDATESSDESTDSEKITVSNRNLMDNENVINGSMEHEKMASGGEETSIDKISKYDRRLSELEAHYKEIQELFKQKMLQPDHNVQELYQKIKSLESQLKIASEGLESRYQVKPDNNVDDSSSGIPTSSFDETNWMSMLSFDSFKKKFDGTVGKLDPSAIWFYYDKTKEVIGVANKATLDTIGKVYDYTKSDEFVSNIANTQKNVKETLNTVNEAMYSQWQAVKKSSEDMSDYVKETGKKAKKTFKERSEQVKKKMSTMDFEEKWQKLKNTSQGIINKTKSTLHDLSEKVLNYSQSDEFQLSLAKTKDRMLETLDEAVKNTRESVSELGDTLADTWSTVKFSMKDIKSKATDNWEAVKEKTGFGKKNNYKKKKEHHKRNKKVPHMNEKEHLKPYNKRNRNQGMIHKNVEVEYEHQTNKKKSLKKTLESIENMHTLLTGNWRQLYEKHFTINCRGDQACMNIQRDDAEILIQELMKYNNWLLKNNYKKDAKKIKMFVNELWPLVNGNYVDDQMLEDLKESLGEILKSMNQRAQKHRLQYPEQSDTLKKKQRKDGRKFAGEGFQSDDEDWYSKRMKGRDKNRHNKPEEGNNYDWFTLRGIERKKARQSDASIDGDWFLERGKDREDLRREWVSKKETADRDWYFKWTQYRSDMRTGMSMWDLYNWFRDWHDHRYLMRH
ncbi:uncharacterized protein [Antedon mediterranea]|uniref:uncharacterized protein isoform X2 n=1 Tax=Antedon mediterranea TaxID=105859 RepID=UPI003AF5CAD2